MSSAITLPGAGDWVELISDGINYHVVSQNTAGSLTEVHGFHLAAQADLILTSAWTPILDGPLYFQNSGVLLNTSIAARLPPSGQDLYIMPTKNGISILSTPLIIPGGLGNTQVYVQVSFANSPPTSPPQTIAVVGALAIIVPASPPILVDQFMLWGMYVPNAGSPPPATTNAQDVFVQMCLLY